MNGRATDAMAIIQTRGAAFAGLTKAYTALAGV